MNREFRDTPDDLGLDIDMFLRSIVEADDENKPKIMISQDRLLELIKAANDSEKYRDIALRTRAASSVVNKRIERAAIELSNSKVKDMLMDILPLMDSFTLAFSNKKNWPARSVVEGLEMVFTQLLSELVKYGLTRIEAVGKKFDPNHHEAVGTATDGSGPGIIVSEVRPGFIFEDRVLRPSQVIVSVPAQGITVDQIGIHKIRS